VSAKNLMDGLTAYADPEELAATAVQAQEQDSVLITVSLLTICASLVVTNE
jgi:hypothetical protein